MLPTTQNVSSRQVQGGRRGGAAAYRGRRRSSKLVGRASLMHPEPPGGGYHPSARRPTLTSAAVAALRHGRKCFSGPHQSLSRSSVAPSRWCSGPAPCALMPGLGFLSSVAPSGASGSGCLSSCGWAREGKIQKPELDSTRAAFNIWGGAKNLYMSKAVGATRFGSPRTGSVVYMVSNAKPLFL